VAATLLAIVGERAADLVDLKPSTLSGTKPMHI